MSITADLYTALPEVFLACAALGLLMLGVFKGEASARTVLSLSVMSVVIALGLVLISDSGDRTAFSNLFKVDGFIDFMKILTLLGSALTMVLTLRFMERESMARFELPILMLLATLGMLLMISANDLMAVYMGIELQSLSLYVCAAIRRDSLRATESGLKYFVLGALSSGMLLYGMSLVYGFTGTTNFDLLAQTLGNQQGDPSVGLIFGLVFMIAGLAFKVSAVPFHMWTPDVYEGAPTPVTAFFAVAPKIAALALFMRVLMGPFLDLADQWQQVIIVISLASMILGSFAAINQRNIKRLMAYSSIGHVGYALIGLAAGTEAGVAGVVVYLTIYLFMNVGTFACILSMRVNERMVEGIDDLKGLSKTNPLMAAALTIFMFSMAGIPPLAGFFGKFYVFLSAVDAGLYALAIIGILTSVVGAFYYLRIIKLMYFDEPVDAFDKPIGMETSLIMAGMAAFTLLFFLAPEAILDHGKSIGQAFFAMAG
ncbi:NADH-quinone oxidoreductase subunit NuoN [Rhodovibrionaceae bacterium A322]